MSDILYFAYGSNLSKKQMEERVGHVPESATCSLSGWKFVFGKKSKDGTLKGDIVPAEGETVLGVVYRCTAADMEKIDKSEGYNIGHYNKRPLKIVTDDGNTVEAIAYVACDEYVCTEGHPSQDYLERIVAGIKDHELGDAYRDTIVAAAGLGAENHD